MHNVLKAIFPAALLLATGCGQQEAGTDYARMIATASDESRLALFRADIEAAGHVGPVAVEIAHQGGAYSVACSNGRRYRVTVTSEGPTVADAG